MGVLPDIVIDVPPKEAQVDERADNQDQKPKAANDEDGKKTDKTDKQAQHIMREADLPGAINAEGDYSKKSVAHLDIGSCPGAGIDEKDRELGCAIAYINSSSPDAFLAKMGGSLKSEAPAM